MVKFIKVMHPNGKQLIPLTSINNLQYENNRTIIVMNTGDRIFINEDLIRMLLVDIESDEPVTVTSGECL